MFALTVLDFTYYYLYFKYLKSNALIRACMCILGHAVNITTVVIKANHILPEMYYLYCLNNEDPDHDGGGCTHIKDSFILYQESNCSLKTCEF